MQVTNKHTACSFAMRTARALLQQALQSLQHTLSGHRSSRAQQRAGPETGADISDGSVAAISAPAWKTPGESGYNLTMEHAMVVRAWLEQVRSLHLCKQHL